MDEIKISFVTPFPGTAIRRVWQDRVGSDFENYSTDLPVVRCDHLSSGELIEARRMMATTYYCSHWYDLQWRDKVT